jgi:hypothetical protein
VAEQVHRAARGDAALARLDANVRRNVCGVTFGIGVCRRARSSSAARATVGAMT